MSKLIIQSLSSRIRLVLLRVWDPIGVKDFPEAQDEYDAYISELAALLIRDCSIDDLFHYLRQLEVDHIGLDGNEDATRRAAIELRRLIDKTNNNVQ